MIPLVETVKPYVNHYGYWAVLIGVFFESLGLPLPGETLLIVAGLAAAKGLLNITWVIVLSVIATFMANNVSYATGYSGGHAFMIKYGKYVFFNEKRIVALENFVRKYGSKVVVIARFIIGMRQFNGFIAGSAKMPFMKFMVFNLVGAILWVGWWASLSFYLGRRFENGFIEYYLLIGIFALVILIIMAFHFLRNNEASIMVPQKTNSDLAPNNQPSL